MSGADVVLVTKNQNKVRELTPIFEEYDVRFEVSAIEKEEVRSDSVETVALHAAMSAYRIIHRPLVTEDTGLYISALKGFPRAYPSFVLETIGRQGILKLMQDARDRSARFVTACAYHDGSTTMVFTGELLGRISHVEAGTGGFGYDPIFVPEGYDLTLAQLGFEEKIAISHRTRAFRALLSWYRKYREGLCSKC
ncbi:MAG: RdgB/HAM1 family non-canonical purine NTP pyrophosphatase [Candidatus Thorarchaeota archaeon]